MMRGDHKTYEVPEHQADATLAQVGPVSGTKYEVLATTKNVRIIGIEVDCVWTVQPTPLEIHVTIDGNVITHSLGNPVSTTVYFVSLEKIDLAETGQVLVTGGETVARQQPIYEGRSVKVEAEITGGTVSALNARVKYAKW